MTWWYVSARGWTCAVRADDDKPFTIREAPPILRKFVGQPMRNLVRWMRHDPAWMMHPYRDDA